MLVKEHLQQRVKDVTLLHKCVMLYAIKELTFMELKFFYY
jgi:hypothetical protein